MNEQTNRLIFDLVQFKRASIEATKKFASLKHNADLCPRLQEKVETIFFAFDKYQRITYDVQGPRDKGVDVVVKQKVDDELHFICFQIKSDDDLKSADYLKILKAQLFDAERAYSQIDNYYIVLCCNLYDSKSKDLLPYNKVTKDKVRAVEAEFATTNNVHVVEPQFALSFLNLSTLQIDAAIKSKLGAEDVIFREALDVLKDLTPTESAILIFLTWLKVYQGKDKTTQQDLISSNFIDRVYAKVPDYHREWFFAEDEVFEHAENEYEEYYEDDNEEYEEDEYSRRISTTRGLEKNLRALMDLDYLANNYILFDGVEQYSLDLEIAEPIAVLMMDGHIRYGYEDEELFTYMMNLFSPMKGYEPGSEEVEA